jgi:hypothetical protein
MHGCLTPVAFVVANLAGVRFMCLSGNPNYAIAKRKQQEQVE